MFNYLIDLLLFACPFFITLILGIVIAWTVLGTRLGEWFSLLSGRFVMGAVFFAIIGCLFGLNEMSIIKSTTKYRVFQFVRVNRRFLLCLDGLMLLISLGFGFLAYLVDSSSAGLLRTAFFLIAGGGGFSIIFVIALAFALLTSLILYLRK
jgi:hypothetical protein